MCYYKCITDGYLQYAPTSTGLNNRTVLIWIGSLLLVRTQLMSKKKRVGLTGKTWAFSVSSCQDVNIYWLLNKWLQCME